MDGVLTRLDVTRIEVLVPSEFLDVLRISPDYHQTKKWSMLSALFQVHHLYLWHCIIHVKLS